jgi:hypothetical protein
MLIYVLFLFFIIYLVINLNIFNSFFTLQLIEFLIEILHIFDYYLNLVGLNFDFAKSNGFLNNLVPQVLLYNNVIIDSKKIITFEYSKYITVTKKIDTVIENETSQDVSKKNRILIYNTWADIIEFRVLQQLKSRRKTPASEFWETNIIMIEKFKYYNLEIAHKYRACHSIGRDRHFWNVWEATFEYSMRRSYYWSGEKYCESLVNSRFENIDLEARFYIKYKELYPNGYPDVTDPKFDLMADLRKQIKKLTLSINGDILLSKYFTFEDANVIDYWSNAHIKRFIIENMVPHHIMDPEEYERFTALDPADTESEDEPYHPLGERTGRARVEYIEFPENPSLSYNLPTYRAAFRDIDTFQFIILSEKIDTESEDEIFPILSQYM